MGLGNIYLHRNNLSLLIRISHFLQINLSKKTIIIFMYAVEVNIENVIADCPFVKDWIDVLNTYIKGSNFPMSKIEAYYDYGYFVPTRKNTPEENLIAQIHNQTLRYEDRLKVELAKVRVSVTIKMGQTILTHRLQKGFIPKTIQEIISEITKVRMGLECDEHGNEDIRKSIPPLSPDIVVHFIDYMPKEEPEMEIDDILDKISKSGFDSLTEEEKEFLDKKSKDI